MNNPTSRRSSFHGVGAGAAALGLSRTALAQKTPIQGFEETIVTRTRLAQRSV